MSKPTAPPHEHVAIQVEMSTPSEARTFVSDTDLPAQSTPVQTEGDQVAIGLAANHGAVVALNALMLCILKTTPLPWTDLMAAAGFVDWPLVPDVRMGTIFIVATMVAGLIAMVVIYWKPRMRSRLFLVLRATATVVALLGFVVILAVPWSNCIPQESVDVLSLQTNAVATYNREYCHAWCRHSNDGSAAQASGDCAEEKTVFNEIVETMAVGEWCHEAIATHTFDLAANHSGVAPFAGLKGGSGCHFDIPTAPRLLVLLNMPLSVYSLKMACRLQ